MYRNDSTLVFDRLFGLGQLAHLFQRNTLILGTQFMTLHCKTKTKNINLFLSKDQLLSEADTNSHTGEICNVRKCGRNLVTATYSGCFGDRYTGLSAQTLAPKKGYSSFLFQLCFNKKQVEVAINDFTMHLIISKWLRIQKCRQKRKTMGERG